jgi:hypothetical protein
MANMLYKGFHTSRVAKDPIQVARPIAWFIRESGNRDRVTPICQLRHSVYVLIALFESLLHDASDFWC